MSGRTQDDKDSSEQAATSLPTPEDTPAGKANMSRRSMTPPPKGPSPPPMHSERKERMAKRASRDITTDETVSILDPRRFTPTLHANLVSEILALRRDQEEKTKVIESLEGILTTSKEQQDDIQTRLSAANKENKSLKRQLALLEGGTSSALGELSRERDEAVEASADVKKRLEAVQKKLRSQEDNSERVHELWARDKDTWDEERRKFERKVHIAESRLKLVLEEVAAFQAAHANGAAQNTAQGHESEAEESAKENDGASVRSMSMTNSIRFSMTHARTASGKAGGATLADELDFDEEDDDFSEHGGRESVQSRRTSHGRHTRTFSRDSVASRTHRRNQSLESLRRPASGRGKLFMNQAVLEALEGEDEESAPTAPRVSYVDTGVQFTPPPSPRMGAVTPEIAITEAKMGLEGDSPPASSASSGPEIEANSRRKRTQISSPAVPVLKVEAMVSSSSQTVEEPLSPPRTPTTRAETPPPEIRLPTMATSSTQTEEAPAMHKGRLSPSPSSEPPLVPSISIQPPTSRPTTPKEPRLPPHFKHFGCQVNILASPADSNDAGVQTEGIQVDKRIARLPPHLQPSHISSRPSSPKPAPTGADMDKSFTPLPGNLPPRNPRRVQDTPQMEIPSSPLFSPDHDELHDAYPGNNDDGPLSAEKEAPIKRPHRFSSLFAGFDTASSEEEDFEDDDASDTEYRTALTAPRPQSISSKAGRQTPSEAGTTSPASKRRSNRSTLNSMKPLGTHVYNSFSLADKEGEQRLGKSPVRYEKPAATILPGPGNRAGVMRKAAMIQSGIATHGSRSRSPSLPEARNPPFPIPQRTTSRKISASAPPSEGQRSPTRLDGWRRPPRTGAYRTNNIRKTRSAVALPRHQRHRQGSRSPPPLSPSTEAAESPGLPPLPRNDITTPRHRGRGSSSAYRRHKYQPSTNTERTTNTQQTQNTLQTNITDPASVASAGHTTGVVDAIAQTMIGEWMFKYVRRRKSFTVPESGGKDDVGNDRHKRWVWLAPYERSILWSSKQPASGSALMGKTGRKLVIQSVLDVKDENPVPKGETGTVFNRSILILTPQRALKFTATSAERHYVWLTALSFLAHSQQAVPEIVHAPEQHLKPQPMPDYAPPPPPAAKIKRGGIRDSIRLAKGRAMPAKAAAAPSVPSLPSAPAPQADDATTSFGIPEYAMGAVSSNHAREQSEDAAEPPLIPRFHDRGPPPAHGRKRSNTGGLGGPPLSFRGFSGPTSTGSGHNPTSSTAGDSINTAGSSDYYNQSQGSGNTGWGMSQTASQRTSEASSRPSNFFDAIGTVRMEAFISPLSLQQFSEHPDEEDEFRPVMRRRSREVRRRQSRRSSRAKDSWGGYGRGSDDRYTGSRTAGEEDYFRDDPFRGF
ncbi:Nuclear migration protein-like protein [Emericellopsis cladophorae]|uniref:Nuclear migration protein-like protein n=1 Tax=Emericellopsis cladophorae TaxID=2686198 RepID=A0A9Q0BHH2_9HYPO|nr:Nuclear migration protein-like protein [Emericellopsis cladophorae]KAI6784399.1 Nuclear migration protein-like protein [Emericellopsis cladophorae]